jgi:hypothetical protein
MLALTLFLEKLDRYVPWATWTIGGGHRLGTPRLRRNGGTH